ncbi:tryptophan 7-halogenase [Sphingopyxis sp. DHUNG17]|nr:tryptophan 7-halogenase [Sphingopyxis lutea]
MTALMFARVLAGRVDVTVIDSDRVPTIGVGEGSTPKLRAFFAAMGISDEEWMPACEASYKVGVEFAGWSDYPGHKSYFHPFFAHFDRDHVKGLAFNAALRRQGIDLPAHPDLFCYNRFVAQKRLSPLVPDRFPFDIQYAYHFDAALLGNFLRRKAMDAGVQHRERHVEAVAQGADGAISGLHLDGGEIFTADLYFDCTGFRALLSEEALHTPYVSFAAALPNDRAIAIATAADADLPPQTTATALEAGWAWSIPLRSRTGHGYVYSSQFLSDDAAERELRRRIAIDGGDARLVRMRVGRLERSWTKNCVAIGLAQGFIEPLEATGLALTQFTATRFAWHFLTKGTDPQVADAFNREVADAFDSVRDFIAAHYLTSSGHQTEYWDHCRANSAALSDNIKAVFESWFRGEAIEPVLTSRRMTQYFSANSWTYMLCGKGVFPRVTQLSPPDPSVAEKVPVASIGRFIERCLLNHEGHAATLEAQRGASGGAACPQPAEALRILCANGLSLEPLQ